VQVRATKQIRATNTKMLCWQNIPAGHSPTPPLSSLIHRFSRVSWITIKSPFIIADFIPMCAGRTPYTHSQLIRCRPYLLHHRPQYPRLDQVQTVPLTPSTTSSLPYSCRPYPLHDSIKQLSSSSTRNISSDHCPLLPRNIASGPYIIITWDHFIQACTNRLGPFHPGLEHRKSPGTISSRTSQHHWLVHPGAFHPALHNTID